MEIVDVAGTIMGAGLCFSGLLALGRGFTRVSPEGEDAIEYVGASARLLGTIWLVIGILLLASFLGPHVGCGACVKSRDFARSYFGA